MRVLKAGWGHAPQDVLALNPIPVNTSRILTRLKCGELDGYVYTDNRVVDWGDTGEPRALRLGTAWHKALERLASGDSFQTISRDYEREEWALDARGASDLPLLQNGLEEYANKYQGDWPTGSILATEVEFWILIDIGVGGTYMNEVHGFVGQPILYRGRIDRLCSWNGQLVNGEIKTVKAGEKMDEYMAERAGHLQDAAYYLAMVHAPNTHGLEPYGTVYDCYLKYTRPKATSGTDAAQAKLAGKLADWREKLFYTHRIAWDQERALAVAGREIKSYLDLEGTRHRNPSACRTYGSCSHFDTCHRGLALSSHHYKDRDLDYVDNPGGI